MAVTFVAASAVATGTTSATPALPSGTAIGDRVFTLVSSGPAATATNTPTGWTKLVNVSLGSGTFGAAAGPRRATVLYRDRDSTWSMPAVTTSGTGAVIAVAAVTLRKDDTDTWDTPTDVTGPKSGTTASYTATSSSSMTMAAGAMLVLGTVLPDNVSSSGSALSATGGVTFTDVTEQADGGTTSGNTARLIVGTGTVATGGTGTITRTSTLSGASDSGGTAFVQQSVTSSGPPPIGVGPVRTTTAGLTSGSANLTSGTLTFPAPAAGNVLVCAFGTDKAHGGTNPPAGWVEIADQSGASTSLSVFYRVADGSETSVSWTWTTAVFGWSGMVVEFANVDTVSPIGPTALPAYSDTARTTMTLDPAVTSVAGRAAAFFSIDSLATTGDSGGGFRPTAAGWSWQATASSSFAGDGGTSFALMNTVSTPAGTDIAPQFTWTTSDQVAGFLVWLNEASSGQHVDVDLSGSGSLTATVAPAATRAASLTGSGTLSTTTSGLSRSTAAALTGSGQLSTTVTPTAAVSAALSGSGTLSTALNVLVPAALSGAGTLSASLAPTASRAVGLTGTGTLSVTTSPSQTASAALSGSGALSVATAPALAATASLTGSGTLAATAVPLTSRSASLTGSGALMVSVAPTGQVSAALTGSGTLTASMVQNGQVSAALSGSGTLTASVAPSTTLTAGLSGSGSLSAVSTGPATSIPAALSGLGTLLAVTDVQTPPITVLFSGDGSLTSSTSNPTATRSVALSGSGALSAATESSTAASVGLSGTGTLEAAVRPSETLSAALSGSGALAASTETPTTLVTVSLSGDGRLTASVSSARSVTADLSGSGALEASTTAPSVTISIDLSGSGELTALAYMTVAMPPLTRPIFGAFVQQSFTVAFVVDGSATGVFAEHLILAAFADGGAGRGDFTSSGKAFAQFTDTGTGEAAYTSPGVGAATYA